MAVQDGGEVGALALVGVLAHGVAVLEALCMSTPRFAKMSKRAAPGLESPASRTMNALSGHAKISALDWNPMRQVVLPGNLIQGAQTPLLAAGRPESFKTHHAASTAAFEQTLQMLSECWISSDSNRLA